MKKNSGLLLAAALAVFTGVISYLHARSLSHFVPAGRETGTWAGLSRLQKLKVFLNGVSVARPVDRATPKDAGLDYQTVSFPGAGSLPVEAWLIRAKPSHGLVILFHGYTDTKSDLLAAAKEFHAMSLDALLVDFNGGGGSAGDDTSIGYHEAEAVAAAARWAGKNLPGEKPLLYGFSMGAAAVLRAAGALGVEARGVIVEAPFDRMLNSFRHHLERMGARPFPFDHFAVFWVGVRQGFNGFAFNPVEYARNVRCPALLGYGDRDPYVAAPEKQAVFDNLAGPKTLKIYRGLAHENFVKARPDEWRRAVRGFIEETSQRLSIPRTMRNPIKSSRS